MLVENEHIKVDIVLLNGKVITADPQDTIAEAVAVNGNRIFKVGSTEEIKKLADGDTNIIDVKCKSILPGFIDAHTHSQTYAMSKKHHLQIHVPPLKSIKDVLNMVKKKVQNTSEGEWIVCRGSFHLDHKYQEKRYPTKDELTGIAPNHPVVLLSGMHIAILNSRALEAAGITKETPTQVKFPGKVAMVEKDPDTGEPSGIVREPGILLPLTKYDEKDTDGALKEVLFKDFIQQGITSIHDMPGREAFRIYQRWMKNGTLPLRVNVYFYMPNFGGCIDPLLDFGFQSGFGNEWLRLGGIKLMVDGGITGPKASLYRPYPHDVYDYGLLNYGQEELTQIYVKAHSAGFQLISHTTGEKAQDMVLNAIETAVHECPRKDHRHRLEHAGNYFATAERMQRMLELEAIPVVNPLFIHAFGFLMEHFYGKRIKNGLFPYRMLLDMGFKLPFSSDCTGSQPEGINPFWGIWCAVKQESFDGSILDPEQRISVQEAIRCYTIYAARAGFEEEIKGSIEPGKLADLIVLSEDPLTVPVDEIKQIKILLTIIDGKIVFDRDHGLC